MRTTFKSLKKITGILSALLLILFSSQQATAQKPKGSPWPAPAAAVNTKNPVKADAVTIKDGKLLYIKNCKSCHGDTGKGDGTKAGNLDISCGDFSLPATAKITDGELFWKITEGRKPMPTFNKKLTDTERWSLVNYIRTLAK
jgi:mono/diheme cytochrome c family protein